MPQPLFPLQSPEAFNSYLRNSITANVAIGVANTFVDIVSLGTAVPSGIYLVVFQGLVGGASGNITAKLWDGTTVFASMEFVIIAAMTLTPINLTAVVQLQTNTLKVTATSTVATQTFNATVTDNNTGTTNTATTLSAVRIG